MVSPFIMSRREFVSCRPGITSIMLPIMILSGWSPIPAFTSSTTASAVAALHSIVTIMSLSLSAVHAQSAAKRMAPESAEAAPSAQEPPKISALDGVIKESIKDKIKQIAREFKLTTIIVTHDPEEALTLSDKVLIVNNGTISQFGAPDEIIQTPDNEFVKEFILNQLVIKKNNIFTLFSQGMEPRVAM